MNPVFPHTYRLDLAFLGTAYHGWQRQPRVITVQEVVENTLRRLFRQDSLALTCCSRTDSGVHADNLTTSFRTLDYMAPDQLTALLDKQLPHDIRVVSLTELPNFNAHEMVRGKAYVYAVLPGCHSVFLKNTCWSWPSASGVSSLRPLLSLLEGQHDFQNFSGESRPGKTFRTIYRAEMYEFGPLICFYFSGSGFLYQMIRRIMGALHEVALGNLSADQFRRMIEEPGFRPSDAVAPPEGLFLRKAFYAPEEWRFDRLVCPPFCG